MARTLAAAALLWGAADSASAVGADAGITVSNTASVVYTVNAVVQPAVASNAADFVVDRRIDLTVTAIGVTYTSVTPATNGAFLFSVANTSNATLGFNLSAANNATDPFGGTDSFDPTTLTAVVDAGTIGTYEPLVDVATTMDTVAEDGTFGVWIVAAIPGGQGNLDIAAVTLTATAREAGIGGAPLVQQAGLESALVMETVFADGIGDTGAARDAAFSDSGAYQVASADVTITKTETLLWDPINLFVNPRHIPGAIVEYTITVANAAGGLSATTLTISDVLPANVAFVPNAYAAGFGIDLDGTDLSNATLDDAGDFTAGTVTVTVPTLLPTASAVITYQVTVN
jgi:uncharacterized repeat protein (TIGR01451 family)